MKDTVLIVDDVEINRIILREILEDDYDILEAEDGQEALDILFNISKLPQAVLLDIMMPGVDGFAVLSAMKSNPTTENIPVLFITAADATINESRGLNEGAVDYIAKPFNPDVVKARVNNHIQLQRYRENLEYLLEQKTSELVEMHEQTMETMASIIEYRSLESGTHIRRCSELSKIIIDRLVEKSTYARELMRLKGKTIVKAVALHDIGKVAIPDNILLKPGRLTDEEFDVIKTHTTIGSDIVSSILETSSDPGEYLARAKEICRSHHERWDGKGYPDGLSGTDIPLAARILSVVDVYDALVNTRCYKPPMTHEDAAKLIIGGRGTQFDPVVVDAFCDVEDKFASMEDYEKAVEQEAVAR